MTAGPTPAAPTPAAPTPVGLAPVGLTPVAVATGLWPVVVVFTCLGLSIAGPKSDVEGGGVGLGGGRIRRKKKRERSGESGSMT